MKCREVRIWKKVVVSHSEYCLGTFLERVEFKTSTVRKKRQESYFYSKLVSPAPDKPAAIIGTYRFTYPHEIRQQRETKGPVQLDFILHQNVLQ
jgi:hypothetical protein